MHSLWKGKEIREVTIVPCLCASAVRIAAVQAQATVVDSAKHDQGAT
jgi:hypothetical protein